MKLRQGSRKRTAWWCWIVLLIAAVVMLPGVAFLVGEKGEPAVNLMLSPEPRDASNPRLTTEVVEPPQTSRLMIGMSTNSDAGATGTVVVDSDEFGAASQRGTPSAREDLPEADPG